LLHTFLHFLHFSKNAAHFLGYVESKINEGHRIVAAQLLVASISLIIQVYPTNAHWLHSLADYMGYKNYDNVEIKKKNLIRIWNWNCGLIKLALYDHSMEELWWCMCSIHMYIATTFTSLKPDSLTHD
jgi:hypothetical protein